MGNQIDNNVMGGECSTYGEEKKCIQVFMEILEGKRPLGRPRHRWKDNIKLDLQEVGWGYELNLSFSG